MSRLYLIILFLLFSGGTSAQNTLGKYLDFAKEQYDKGDYYYALEYYQKAMELDSNSVAILWNYAETLRAYKDYRNAEIFYAKVYEKESAGIYPYSLLYLGLMQKQNGKYEEAIATFTKAKKKYSKNKKSYPYEKSKRELESTLWAKSALLDSAQLIIEPLPETINTKNAEFGHLIYDDHLIFSSLRADSVSEAEEVYATHYKTRLYSSKMEAQTFEESELIESLFLEQFNTGNGTFSLDGKRFYFSQCSDAGTGYFCKIMVSRYEEGKWSKPDSLGQIINSHGNNTMPCIADIKNEEWLIFASDREGGLGGLDLYYSKIKNGNQYSDVKALKTFNTPDNDITPFWDNEKKRFYYSNSWLNGFGGYDVFYSDFTTEFSKPENAGLPVNSFANDLYYFTLQDTAFVSSNRIGVMYSKNPTCCSDIFSLKPPVKIEIETPLETLEELNKRLPVTLYFHNDEPNPKNWDTITPLNYMKTYEDYRAMLETYKKEYAKGLKGDKILEAEEDIESFFMQYVDQGVHDLELFRNLVLKELDKGAKINVTIKGFASPLAKTDYNVNLTKRRISSLMNHLRSYDNGIFVKYLDGTAENGGKLVFTQIPFGEYKANQLTSDNPNDVQNSVYSRAAAIERKIEIQSVTYINEEELALKVEGKPLFNAGVIGMDKEIEYKFTIVNTSNHVQRIDSLEVPCDCTSGEIEKMTLQPGEQTTITMKIDTSKVEGFFVKAIYLHLEGTEEKLPLYISGQVVK